MSKLFVKILSFMLIAMSLLTLTACDISHKHVYDQKNSSADYLASKASCTAPAKYYFSCTCGEKGTETFDLGSPNHDYIDHVCQFCQKTEDYTKGLTYFLRPDGNCSITGFEDDAIIPWQVIIPTKMENAPVTHISQGAFENSTFSNIVLPEGLQCIMTGAFKNSQLSIVTIPSTVTMIYPEAFYTQSLTNVTFLSTSNWYRNKHLLNQPSDDYMVSVSLISNATSVAKEFKDYDSLHTQGGANVYWFKIDK